MREAASGGRWLRLDVTNADQIAAAVAQVESEAGRIDVLELRKNIGGQLAHLDPPAGLLLLHDLEHDARLDVVDRQQAHFL